MRKIGVSFFKRTSTYIRAIREPLEKLCELRVRPRKTRPGYESLVTEAPRVDRAAFVPRSGAAVSPATLLEADMHVSLAQVRLRKTLAKPARTASNKCGSGCTLSVAECARST